MSKVKTYADVQNELVKTLVENNTFEGNTGNFAFDDKKIPLPEGVTNESIALHQDLFDAVPAALEVATAQLTRSKYESDDKFTVGRGSLRMGNMTFNTEHTLQNTVGEESYYGTSTTIVDVARSPDASEWLADQRTQNETLAKKLFG